MFLKFHSHILKRHYDHSHWKSDQSQPLLKEFWLIPTTRTDVWPFPSTPTKKNQFPPLLQKVLAIPAPLLKVWPIPATLTVSLTNSHHSYVMSDHLPPLLQKVWPIPATPTESLTKPSLFWRCSDQFQQLPQNFWPVWHAFAENVSPWLHLKKKFKPILTAPAESLPHYCHSLKTFWPVPPGSTESWQFLIIYRKINQPILLPHEVFLKNSTCSHRTFDHLLEVWPILPIPAQCVTSSFQLLQLFALVIFSYELILYCFLK